ncbi:DUF4262 domain-containing protein [Ornithinimicrobium sp. F0845]|uniref:DUF4262 domain-containing protein n=1 Tax=Ornithinimicrobium sp. F0845 TaxID=2926412 RepID=UPI001FF54568|nr:DUF4262 domain-containing protein [Ornithinimicrobium sp. F0845]MCK0112192.1 DUF4262 domain-containing protein [Ornithinimicrobium sp. F0845]
MDNSAALRAFEDRERSMITDHIRTHGVHLTYISTDGGCDCCRELGEAAPGSSDTLAELVGGAEHLPARLSQPFCYTTGLYGVGHPELVVLGLPQDVSMALLNAVAHQVTGHRQDLVPGQLVPHLQPQILVEEIPNPGMVVFQANDYYHRPFFASVPAYQLTWSDPAGRFPWDEGHDGGPWEQPRPGTYRA